MPVAQNIPAATLVSIVGSRSSGAGVVDDAGSCIIVMKRAKHAIDAHVRRRLPPPDILLRIAFCIDDAPSLFSFLDALGTPDARGPLEPLWLLRTTTSDLSRLWPTLHLDDDGVVPIPRACLEPIAKYYRHVIIRGAFDFAWLRRHLHPTATTIDWRFMPTDDARLSTSLAAWYDTWATFPITHVQMAGAASIDALVRVLPALRHRLVRLDLQHTRCTSRDDITAFLATATQVTDVTLHNVHDSRHGRVYTARMLRDLVQWCKGLTSKTDAPQRFRLGECYFSEPRPSTDRAASTDTAAKTEFFATLFSTLTTLHLTAVDLHAFDFTTTTFTMDALTLDQCQLSSTHVDQLSRVVTSRVRHLALRGLTLVCGDEAHTSLTRLWHAVAEVVTSLDMGKCVLQRRGSRVSCPIDWAALAPLLRHMRRLERLQLDANGIDDAAAAAIAAAVERHATLRSINLEANDVGARGVLALLNAKTRVREIELGRSYEIATDDGDMLHQVAARRGIRLGLSYSMNAF
ncbi:Aste57867_2797 [Aphanomyces stellatus]|uniref:Aste57867_2797 protein n=1 Tax=Aphanomyces stellatus TaxID=120398 RepID=A0A485K9Z2_9STRA|nr:hypothetical protein As57867_002790 [Aphanomyces stellatus]VFT79987.1 Aste57867_2797 [Aphanomyces stellatus]